MTYRIKDWSAHFENSETARYKTLKWVPVPNKHDGKGFGRIAKLKNAPEIYAAWHLILQIASKMPVRGTLKDEDGDLTPEDMAVMTGFPEKIFKDALSVLIMPKIAWIEQFPQTCGRPAADLRQSPNNSGAELNRIEQNRIEQKKHIFKNSPFFVFDFFRAELQEKTDWSNNKIIHYYEAAKDYSEANPGKKYASWIAAVKNWDRMRPFDENAGKTRLQIEYEKMQKKGRLP